MPEIAARAHVEALDRIIAQGDGGGRHAASTPSTAIAAAGGPGLIGGVIVGLTTAKAIALVKDKPLIAVNHLEAHALTARLTDDTPFPYCLFLASGGHTQILAVRGVGDYVRLGTTLDDAIGEAFDKTAKLLGLGYPGGPQVEKEAAARQRRRASRCRGRCSGRKDADFSLSGLKTALRLEAEKIAPLTDQDVADLCASFQQAVVDVVFDRLRAGLRLFRARYGTPTALVAAGGVAANQAIRKVLQRRRLRGRHRAGRAAARAVHRQRRDDRLGRRRAAGARLDRYARRRAARALAARRDRRRRRRAPPNGGIQMSSVLSRRMSIRPHRGARRRRLGNRARQRTCARAGRDVTLWEHRRRQRRAACSKAREPIPAAA